jgi:general secretion pathway protein G
MKRFSKGFTLIELLVVIAIIGLLSTLAVVALNSARQRSRDAKRVADIRQIQTALELGFSEVGAYPVVASSAKETLGGTDAIKLCATSATAQAFLDSGGACGGSGTVYMGLVPKNPTPSGQNYEYWSNAGGSNYVIQFSLEGVTGQLGSGVNCATSSGIQAAGGASCSDPT